MAGNINDCLADTNCIGMVENVDTRKVVVGVENEGVLNTLKINESNQYLLKNNAELLSKNLPDLKFFFKSHLT